MQTIHLTQVLPFAAVRHSLLLAGVLCGLLGAPGSRASGPEIFERPLVGSRGEPGFQDGFGSEARFSNPSAVVADKNGNLYVADSLNNAIRKVSPAGQVTTLAGQAVDLDGDGITDGGSDDGLGLAARFYYPAGVAVDDAGTVFVSDAWNHTIRSISPAGLVTTLAGQAGNYGHRDGPAAEALFDDPCGIVVDQDGNLYVVERGSHIIRRISHDGSVSTLAGLPGQRGTADGQGVNARFDRPSGLALDAAGNLWVTDTGNHTIRRVSREGWVTTVAGRPGVYGHLDGEASSALFFEPRGVVVEPQGNVVIADTYNNAIRKLTLDGQVETLQSAPPSSSGDAGQTPEQLLGPSGLALGENGILLVADAGNHLIQSAVEVTPVSLRVSLESGIPVLQIEGGLGRSCTIETCSDATPGAPWQTLLRVNLASDSVSISDATAAGVPFRLYRVRP